MFKYVIVQCNSKLMEDLKTLKSCGEILISLLNSDRAVLLFSYQTSSVKHHLTETHEHNFEIHNIVLSSQSISLTSSITLLNSASWRHRRVTLWRPHSVSVSPGGDLGQS